MNIIKLKIFICLSLLVVASCKSPKPPGLQFEMMKNTPVWSLAKAVEDEDTVEIRKLIQEEHLDVNYKENKSEWGTTLLHLAVLNSKLFSVKALLKNGARQDIRDSLGEYPINKIVDFTTMNEHRLEILELLLQFGANPNAEVKGYRDGDTTPYQVGFPLMRAISNLECTKLLLKFGANVYCNITSRNFLDSCHSYPVWDAVFLFSDNKVDENIMVAKYLVVDKHLSIPEPLYYRGYNTEYDIRPVTALGILNKASFTDPAKQKAKEEILAYLQKEGFPEYGAIPNPPPKR